MRKWWEFRAFRLFLLLAALSSFLFGQAREISLSLHTPFRFVAYGDTRFTNPNRTSVSNGVLRRDLIAAIAEINPAFISIGGDLVYKGDSSEDWRIWSDETAPWRERSIPVFPALGNHDLRGNQTKALANYFSHFPELENSRYYSVRVANTLMLVLDSSFDELSGARGQWFRDKIDRLPPEINFVVVVLHHPLYTNSHLSIAGSGHEARAQEKKLAQWLESKQQVTRARFVVFTSHVHNYERYERGGVVYFVTGGGGAHPYAVSRQAGDPLSDEKVNYHYLLVEVEASKMSITMNRLAMKDGKPIWTQPDRKQIEVPGASAKEQ
jgi:calcineurin-like phosphoesterase family protein